MAEEHGFQSPEGHRLCVNNCGFFGSPATKNLCSKCLKKTGDSSPIFSTPPLPSYLAAVVETSPSAAEEEEEGGRREAATVAPAPQPAPTNRCFGCRKKVGLTGFRCRCGPTFCGTHRYPEKHGCGFDYKGVGREAIAKSNPVIRSEKLGKI